MQKKSLLMKLLTVAFCLTILVPLVQAQYRASLRGVVTDPQGAVLQGVAVTLLNTDTNAVMTTKTDMAGIYVFNALPTANYKLTIEQTGFRKLVLEKVLIIPDQLNALDLKLQVGQNQEVVTVSDTTQTMDTETATVGTTIATKDVATMPSFGRDVFKLVQLAPGVFGDNSNSNLPGSQGLSTTSGKDGIFKTENGPQIAAAGQSAMNNSYTIDGISTVSATWGGTTIITPSEDSVQEVKVVAQGYDAEFGRFAGAQVQVTTKSGSNQVHGSAFFTRHTPGLNAYQPWNGPYAVQRDTNRFSQFGGSLGGPIWKNKVFGFFSWETVRSPQAQVNTSNHWYETSSLAAAAPSGSIASKYLTFPNSRPNATSSNNVSCSAIGLQEGTNCATITGQGLDIGSPLTSALGTQDLGWQNAGNPGVGSGLDGVADIANYNVSSQEKYTYNQYIGRLDANVTSKDRLSFSIYDTPKTHIFQQGDRPYGANFNHNEQNNAYTVIWNRVISNNFVNEARANAAGWRWNEGADNKLPIGLPADSVTQIGNINLTTFGTPYFSHLNQWTYSYKDVATWVHGRHTAKFGGELTRLYYLQQSAFDSIPNYTFYNIWDFLNDAPKSETAKVDPATGKPTASRQDQIQNIWGFFFQDDYRLRRNLTVNVGLRWSYFAPLYSKQNNMFRAVPGEGTAFLSDLKVVRGPLASSAQKGNFGPQFGFAWSPERFHDKMVVRGGYGISYNQAEIAITANISNNPGLAVSQTLNSDDPAHINSNIVYGVSSNINSLDYPTNPAFITTLGANGLPTNGTADIFIFPKTMPSVRVQHYSLDTQYDFGKGWIATLGYQGSKSDNLLFNAQIGPYAASKGYLPPNEHIAYTGWDNYWNMNGFGNYNAMLAELKHSFSHGVMFDAQYTWSKTMDTSTGPYAEQPYPNDPILNYGRSDNDVKNALKLYGSYSPTFFKSGNQLTKTVLDGWTITGIYNMHSGFPWSPMFNINGSAYCGGCWYSALYPGKYLGGAGHDTSNGAFKSGSNYANPNYGLAYFAPPTYTTVTGWGSPATNPVQGVHRNTLTGPSYRSLDMTLVKSFALPTTRILGEAAKFEFRIDAYNLFNNLNIKQDSVDKTVASWNSGANAFTPNSNFGKASGALGGRTMTLGARFNF